MTPYNDLYKIIYCCDYDSVSCYNVIKGVILFNNYTDITFNFMEWMDYILFYIMFNLLENRDKIMAIQYLQFDDETINLISNFIIRRPKELHLIKKVNAKELSNVGYAWAI